MGIGPLQYNIQFQRFSGYRKCRHKFSLSDYLVIDICVYKVSDTSPLYQI